KVVVGSATAKVDGEEVELDSPAYIDEGNNRTYLPVRFVAEALGATVGWDEATKTVTLTGKIKVE
ncbi:MAG: copper amine oxidase N-terminal domain-containing protein, partial [Clostridia bacterium]|nr:copper amine oxidase N-terminal domain-containing protein [Clostridia bacterium]